MKPNNNTSATLHATGHTSSGPADVRPAHRSKTALGSGIVLHPPHSTADAAAGEAVEPSSHASNVGSGDTTATKPLGMTLAEKLAAKKQRNVRKMTRTRPLLRKMGNDFCRTMKGWSRDAILVDSYDYTDEGVFEVTQGVADYIIDAGRAKVLFDAELRIAITITGHTFINFAKIDVGDAASAYADAVEASETEWTWVVWENGAYNWGTTPDEIQEPVWPTDRTPDQLYESMLAGRHINDVNHHLVQRIVLGRR